MKNKLSVTIILFILNLILNSCEGVVKGSGKVISAHNKSPIDSVQIMWRGIETYTDDLGNFEIEEFVGCPLGCPDLELTLTKKGFSTRNIYLTKENDGRLEVNGVTILLNPSYKAQVHK